MRYAAALFCSLAAICRHQAPACAQAPTLSGLPVVISTAAYELSAPSPEALAVSRLGVDLAVSRFRRHFGADPPRIAIQIVDGRGEPAAPPAGVPLLIWFTRDGLEQARSHSGTATAARDSARDREFVEAALPHEACHVFIAAYLDSHPGATAAPPAAMGGTHRGAARIPAWLNEGIAILCEPEDWQVKRRSTMARRASEAIAFSEFLSMPHPMSASRTSTPGMEERGRLFYAQAFSLVEFIREREGSAFIGTLARALADGERLPAVLARSRTLPGDPAALEAAWRAWLASPERVAGPS
jgi:hypothetical protein